MTWRSARSLHRGLLSLPRFSPSSFHLLSSFLFPHLFRANPSHPRLPCSIPSRLLAVLTLLALMLALAPVMPAYANAIVVTGNGDAIANDGICTLREAINAANDDSAYFNCAGGVGPDTISFAAPYVITLSSTLPPISSNITIAGKGASATIIQASASPNIATYRIFYVTSGNSLALRGITVRHGRCNGSCATFTNNGGAIYNGGSLTINGSTIARNSAGLGGAIYNQGSLTVGGTTFSGNHASDGGAISNDSGDTAVINASSFVGNSADTGGALANGGTMTVTNSTFAANTAAFNGGGINNSSLLTLNNSTFSGNTASPGAAVSNSSDLSMRNSILANSTAGGDCNNSGTLTSNVNNLVEDGSCSAALSGDPKLSPLADNGGNTRTFAPLAGSPAIDGGNVATCSSSDQRGYPRPQDGNGDGMAICDIGSVEKLRSLTFRSIGAQDGWVLESSENSSTGGSLNNTLTTFRLGDESGNEQYRGVLSFNTLTVPDTAVVPRIILKIQRQSITNTNPFTTHGSLLVDIRKGVFGGNAALQLADFSALSNLDAAGVVGKTPLAGAWYQAVLKPAASSSINKGGVTQFRLRFQLDDNNDGGADYLSFFSGNNGTIASRPLLYVEYYIP